MASKMIDLKSLYGITTADVRRNPAPAELVEHAVRFDGGVIVEDGAVVSDSGEKTGRSPTDKRVVTNPESESSIWWRKDSQRINSESYRLNRQRAIDYMNTCPRIYVIDGFIGWDAEYRQKVRIVCTRPYHALFMHVMLVRPTEEELTTFGEPDWVVFNGGCFKSDPQVEDVSSQTCVSLNLEQGESVILGTEYAGEMKKGLFTAMMYISVLQKIMCMHCSANEGAAGDVSLFFGLSGTGKTTLSADPQRRLIGDDEHCWTPNGIFNLEGGNYAKLINLSASSEPLIYAACRRIYSVMENVKYCERTRMVDFDDDSVTENTRGAYMIDYIPGAKIPCVGSHPQNVVMLTCDAYGVLPPVAKLTPEQAMYHFISGYTAKVAGTEVGVKEPQATFSPCFGGPFLVWHPPVYAEQLAEKMQEHGSQAWLVNTGWSGGGYGVGERMSLSHTRGIIDAIHDGSLAKAPTEKDPIFGLDVPTECDHAPNEILIPRGTWDDPAAYDAAAGKLAAQFAENFQKYADKAGAEIAAAGPSPS